MCSFPNRCWAEILVCSFSTWHRLFTFIPREKRVYHSGTVLYCTIQARVLLYHCLIYRRLVHSTILETRLMGSRVPGLGKVSCANGRGRRARPGQLEQARKVDRLRQKVARCGFSGFPMLCGTELRYCTWTDVWVARKNENGNQGCCCLAVKSFASVELHRTYDAISS